MLDFQTSINICSQRRLNDEKHLRLCFWYPGHMTLSFSNTLWHINTEHWCFWSCILEGYCMCCEADERDCHAWISLWEWSWQQSTSGYQCRCAVLILWSSSLSKLLQDHSCLWGFSLFFSPSERKQKNLSQIHCRKSYSHIWNTLKYANVNVCVVNVNVLRMFFNEESLISTTLLWAQHSCFL